MRERELEKNSLHLGLDTTSLDNAHNLSSQLCLSAEVMWRFLPALCSHLTLYPILRYHVMVKATSRIGSVVSESHLIRVQKRIMANRLMSTASALVNANVSFECRLNFGTDVAYLWNFGDGTIELGSSSSSHVYSR